MESLYSKLYEKYSKLKTRKESEIDRYTRDQEVKFLHFSSAAEELIDYLRNENSRLQTQLNDFTKEVASTRYAKEEQFLEYEQLLNAETQKTKELSLELERLRQQEQLFYTTLDGKNGNGQLESPGGTSLRQRDMPNGSSRKRPSFRPVADQTDEARVTSYESCQTKLAVGTGAEKDTCRDMLSDEDQNLRQGSCCGRNSAVSGDAANENCLFQTLLECLVGMKFNISEEGTYLSALHQSSGYSFSLTWVSKAAAGESVELLYHVTSWGTFERVAPEWMREDLMFSTSMCLVFFKRLSLVIGLNL